MESKTCSTDRTLQCTVVVGLLDSIIEGILPTNQRVALIASLKGMSLQEIASRMEASRSSVFRLNSESRLQIKKFLEQRNLSLYELRAALDGREENCEDLSPI